MKRTIFVAAAALLAGSVFAAECGKPIAKTARVATPKATATSSATCKPVAEYKVRRISYKSRSLDQSLQHILLGTPYRGVVEGGEKVRIKAKRLSGPLSLTLDQVAGQVGMTWQQDGCVIRLTDKSVKSISASEPAPVSTLTASPVASTETKAAATQPTLKPMPTIWPLEADQPIHKQFAEWARSAGWRFEWRLDKSWFVPAATQFSGTFDQALSEAVESLYAQGKPVRLILWEGNRFAEIVDVDAK